MPTIPALGGIVLAAAILSSPPGAARAAAEGASEMQTRVATGRFDVKLGKAEVAPATPVEIARRTLDKRFEGMLAGTGRGEMLMTGTPVDGSAAYVAIEKFEGTLDGKTGSFTFAHHGVLDRGAPQQLVQVVPDSGTGELAGLTGRMRIDIAADGEHTYHFEYALPAE